MFNGQICMSRGNLVRSIRQVAVIVSRCEYEIRPFGAIRMKRLGTAT
jgi:hypothetical protein